MAQYKANNHLFTLPSMKRLLLTAYAVITALSAYACDCVYTPFLSEVDRSKEIFIGKILYENNTEASNLLSYHFSVLQVYKGKKSDTLNITTKSGGPACGMDFEIGKTYVVYASEQKSTSRCSRTSLVDEATDLGKLKYLFQNSFSDNVGKASDPVITNNEAEYFNLELSSQRKKFDFHQKKIAFVLKNNSSNKVQYFKNWSREDIANTLIILTPEEKLKYSDYDAIIVSQRSNRIGTGFRKRMIKKLKIYRPM